MDHIWESDSIGTVPNPPSVPSVGYPSEGLNPTKPGAWWFHMVTEELRNTILAAGLTPSGTVTNQLAQAVAALVAQNSGGSGSGSGQGAFTVLTNPFTMPGINASAVAIMRSTAWLSEGAFVYIVGAGTLRVASIGGTNSATLTNTGINNNSSSGTIIPVNTSIVATGMQGAQGIAGSGAYTQLTASFVQPAAGVNVLATVANTSWMVVSQPIFITIGGNYTVYQILDSQNVMLTNTGGVANAVAGGTIPSGAGVGASGSAGPKGNPGDSGVGAYTNTTQPFNMPGVGSNVTVSVGNALWLVVGQSVYLQNAGYFKVNNLVNNQSVVLTNLGYVGNAAPGAIISGGSGLSPAGVPGVDGGHGVNTYTVLTAGFTQPATGANVNASVVTSAFLAAGQYIYIQTGGFYQVQRVIDGTTLSVTNLGTAGNGAPGVSITTGNALTISGIPGASGTGSGTVTAVSVVAGNGLTGTVQFPNSTPTITLSTTVSGILKGLGGALVSATAGTDYPGLAVSNTYSALQVYTAGGNYAGAASPILLAGAPGTGGQVLTSSGPGVTPSWVTPTNGTVTNVTVASANGFTGSVATNTSTPVITISVTPTGILKSNGTAISAATAGTDYAVSNMDGNWSVLQTLAAGINLTGGTSPLKLNGSSGTTGQVLTSAGAGATPTWSTLTINPGTVTNVSVVTANGFAGSIATSTATPAITLSTTFTGMAVSTGGTLGAAVAGTDYVSPSAAATITGLLSIAGSNANPGIGMTNWMEFGRIVGAAPAATETIYLASGQVLSYSQASANWVFNIAWSASTSLNTALGVNGAYITVVAMVPQGSTAYHLTGLQIDGVAVTPLWLGGGGMPSAGHASSTDRYTFKIMRTGSATYSVYADLTQFM